MFNFARVPPPHVLITHKSHMQSYRRPPGGAGEGQHGAGQGGGGSQATLADRHLHSQPGSCPPSHLFLPL